MGNDKDGFVFYEPGKSLLNGSFVLHVQAGGGFVQQDDGRVLQEGPCDSCLLYTSRACYPKNINEGGNQNDKRRTEHRFIQEMCIRDSINGHLLFLLSAGLCGASTVSKIAPLNIVLIKQCSDDIHNVCC